MPDSRSHVAIKKQVLSLLRNHGHKAYRPKEIAKTLGFKDNKRYKAFREVLDELARTNQMERVTGGRFQHRNGPVGEVFARHFLGTYFPLRYHIGTTATKLSETL